MRGLHKGSARMVPIRKIPYRNGHAILPRAAVIDDHAAARAVRAARQTKVVGAAGGWDGRRQRWRRGIRFTGRQ